MGQAATAQTAFLVRSLPLLAAVVDKRLQVVALAVPVVAAVVGAAPVAQRRHLAKAMQAAPVDPTAHLLEVVVVAAPVLLVQQEQLRATVEQVYNHQLTALQFLELVVAVLVQNLLALVLVVMVAVVTVGFTTRGHLQQAEHRTRVAVAAAAPELEQTQQLTAVPAL
jgi:TRAP-type uncharacterized transport system fused permease subunit